MLNGHENLEDYLHAVQGRLDKGEREYGDTGYHKPLSKLMHEMAEEAEDIAGWGYLTWRRCIQNYKRAIALEREIEKLEAHRDALKAEIEASR